MEPSVTWGAPPAAGAFGDLSTGRDADGMRNRTTNKAISPPLGPRGGGLDGTAFGQFTYGGGGGGGTQFGEPPVSFGGELGGGQRQEVDEDEDLPLLEELGIHPMHIRQKAMSVINPFKIKHTEACREWIEDEDLAGPFVFALLFGFALMLQGKMDFSHLYAYGVTSTGLLYGLLNLMSGQRVGVTFTVSILGYNILPLVFLALLTGLGWLLLSSPAWVVMPTCGIFIFWAAWCATQMFVVGLGMDEQRFLVLYPMLLFYSTFALIAIF